MSIQGANNDKIRHELGPFRSGEREGKKGDFTPKSLKGGGEEMKMQGEKKSKKVFPHPELQPDRIKIQKGNTTIMKE